MGAEAASFNSSSGLGRVPSKISGSFKGVGVRGCFGPRSLLLQIKKKVQMKPNNIQNHALYGIRKKVRFFVCGFKFYFKFISKLLSQKKNYKCLLSLRPKTIEPALAEAIITALPNSQFVRY